MVEQIIEKMIDAVNSLKEAIKLDIEDVRNANHEKLLDRNNYKLSLIQEITALQENLSIELAKEIENGVDIEIYKQRVDNLEDELRELYELNGKLASIVLPVKQMYSEIIEEIEKYNGGNLVDIRI